MAPSRRVLVEADGGSRGNPGQAGFGAVLKDAATGDVIAEAAESIGVASNNVAEYMGLIAGLELYVEHTPDALLEVRMDSKLVIEQMAGRWKVKHPNMRPLAIKAQQLAPFGTVWTWMPREQNKHADRLANLAMDAAARGEVYEPGSDPVDDRLPASAAAHVLLGWNAMTGTPTRLVFLRHGETQLTADRKFSGPGSDQDPGLIEAGVEQARRAARALSDMGGVDALVSSPLRRTRETAEVVAVSLGLEVEIDDGFRECAFGVWDGLTFRDVEERWPREFREFFSTTTARPPGGESIGEVQTRVEASLLSTVERHREETVVVVSHVNPIKLAVRYCLQAPWTMTHRMVLAPASLTTLWFYESGASVMRSFSVVPPSRGPSRSGADASQDGPPS